jgi:uncharacterized membrane protein
MAKLVLGAFADRKDADEAIIELEQAGVPQSDFSLFAREIKQSSATVRTAENTAAAGGAIGGLAGLTLGAITSAGMLVAGPAALLAGLGWIALTTVTGGAAGAAAGGIVRVLVGLGISEDAARQHESVVNAGGILLGVEDSELSESEIGDCFKSHDAAHIAVVEHGKINARLTATPAQPQH